MNHVARPSRRIRLLVVEDDSIAARGLELALAEEGFEIEIAHSGREAIGTLIHRRSEVLVIDLTLPDIDGAVVADTVRRGWPEMPIIMTSGHDQPPRIAPLLLDHRTAFLQKPYEMNALVAAIERAMNPTTAKRVRPEVTASFQSSDSRRR